jgi:hypothetical protein
LHVRFPIKDDKSEKEADGKESKPEQTESNQNKPEEKTILHKKYRSGKNSEGPAENSWVLDLCPAK